MKAGHLIKGQQAEAAAGHHLKKHRISIVAKNVQSKFGELDLVCLDGDELVFVEVRYRSHPGFGSAAETVNIRKQQKLIRAAQFFLSTHPEYSRMTMRFDVIGIDKRHSIEWIKGAFLS